MAGRAARETLVIVGAGYAGLTAYLELRRRPGRPRTRVVLVDRAPSHYFTTELHEFAAGEEDERDVTVPLSRIVEPPDELRVATVERIDVEGRRAIHEDGELPFDRLLLAVGSVPEYFGVPGAARHGLVLQDLRGARRLRRRLERLARERPRARLAVVGGGLTGVQLAAEVADSYPDFQVTLFDAGERIMPGFDADLAGAAERVLKDKGIVIRCGRPVTSVEEGRLTLKGGEPRACDLLVWAGGVRANPVAERSGLPCGRDGRVRVDEHLAVPGTDGRIFAAGDCAAALDPASGRPVPPSAQMAVQEGRLVARNLWRSVAGGEPDAFVPRQRGILASLGHREGVGRLGRESLYGVPALVVKRLVEAHHAYDVGGLAYLLRRLAAAAGWGRPSRRRRRISRRAPEVLRPAGSEFAPLRERVGRTGPLGSRAGTDGHPALPS